MLQVAYSNGGGTNEGNMRTLSVVLILEVIILGGLVVYFQFRYAQANYPKSSRWQWALFLSGFVLGATSSATIFYFGESGSATIFHQDTAIHELLLFSLLGGTFTGLLFRFLFPRNMQRMYPKRSDGRK